MMPESRWLRKCIPKRLHTKIPVSVWGILTATSGFPDTGIHQWSPNLLSSQTGPHTSRCPPPPTHTCTLAHTHVHTMHTQLSAWCLTVFLLLPLGFPVLVLALIFQDILNRPFRKLLPSWEGKGLGVADWLASLPPPQ